MVWHRSYNSLSKSIHKQIQTFIRTLFRKVNPGRKHQMAWYCVVVVILTLPLHPPLLSTQFTSRPELPLENVMNFWPLVMDLSLDVPPPPPPTAENRTRIVYNSWTLVPPDNLTSTDVILVWEFIPRVCVCHTWWSVTPHNIYVIQWYSETIRWNP